MKHLRNVPTAVLVCAFCLIIIPTRACAYIEAKAAGLAFQRVTPLLLAVSVAIHFSGNRSELASACSHGAGRMLDVHGF